MAQSSVGTPWEAVRPDPEVAGVVARSLDRPEEMAHLSAAFLGHFGALVRLPGSEGLLSLAAAERLLASVLSAVTHVCDSEDAQTAARAEAELVDLGTWLHQAGLDADGLRAVGYALVRAAREGADSQWTTAVGSAWSAVQAWLVSQLLLGARREPTLVTPMTPIPAMPGAAPQSPSARGSRFPFGRRR